MRETQLFMEEDGYVEGWAVFDHDTFTDHAHAFDLAKNVPGLYIAFSSYCFEEWILLHFERNPKAFSASVCKDAQGKDRGCGTGVEADCHGSVCLGGYIREQKYIPDYAKNQEDLFLRYTLPRLPLVFLNAAWSRTLEAGMIYERNPFTNVDFLIKRLLGKDNDYFWQKADEDFVFCGSKLCMIVREDTVVIQNKGNGKVVLTGENCFWCDAETQKKESAVQQTVLLDAFEECLCVRLCHATFLCLKDATRLNYVQL